MQPKVSLQSKPSLVELMTNWLAILVLLAVGVVWPPL